MLQHVISPLVFVDFGPVCLERWTLSSGLRTWTEVSLSAPLWNLEARAAPGHVPPNKVYDRAPYTPARKFHCYEWCTCSTMLLSADVQVQVRLLEKFLGGWVKKWQSCIPTNYNLQKHYRSGQVQFEHFGSTGRVGWLVAGQKKPWSTHHWWVKQCSPGTWADWWWKPMKHGTKACREQVVGARAHAVCSGNPCFGSRWPRIHKGLPILPHPGPLEALTEEFQSMVDLWMSSEEKPAVMRQHHQPKMECKGIPAYSLKWGSHGNYIKPLHPP